MQAYERKGDFFDYPESFKKKQKTANDKVFKKWSEIEFEWENGPAKKVIFNNEKRTIKQLLTMMLTGELSNSEQNRGANASVIGPADYFNMLKQYECMQKFKNAIEMSAWSSTDRKQFVCSVIKGHPLADMRMLKVKRGPGFHYEQWDGRNRCLAILCFMSGLLKINLPEIWPDGIPKSVAECKSTWVDDLFLRREILVKVVEGGTKNNKDCVACSELRSSISSSLRSNDQQTTLRSCRACQMYIDAHCYISEDTYGANQGARMGNGDKVGLLSFDTETNRYLNELTDLNLFNDKELLIMQHGSRHSTILDIIMTIDINIAKGSTPPKTPRSTKVCQNYLGNAKNKITHKQEIELFCKKMQDAICTPEGMAKIKSFKNTSANANRVFSFLRSKIPPTYEGVEQLAVADFDWNMI